MEQGRHSFVNVQDGRIIKHIDPINQYNEFVAPYEECKVLKYVSKLGPQFPQNVRCEGYLKLSYSYVNGITLKKYLKHNELTVTQQKNIIRQMVDIHYKLFVVGFLHNDPGMDNYVIDDDGMIHIVDFGFAGSPYRDPISVYKEHAIIYDEDSDSSELLSFTLVKTCRNTTK
jgi:serine/threonine protein kinase